MSFYHVIKLLINLFVFLLSAWGEDESRVELRALTALVLLLVQCLARFHNHRKRRWGKHEGMKVRSDAGDMEMKRQTPRGKKKQGQGKRGKERVNDKYLHTVSVC